MKGKFLGWLIVINVFVLGAIAGGAGVFAWSTQQHTAMVREGAVDTHRARVLGRKLDLDDTQESRVAAILTDHKGRADDEIRYVLRPDQQRRFDHMVSERPRHPKNPPRFQ